MPALVTIGEFARLSHLSVKTLRHYHEREVLVPAHVDADTGYRRYDTSQVPRAHLIRRLRDLDVPLEEVRRVVSSPDAHSRDRILTAHLTRMEAELARTREVVASLRRMLDAAAPELEVARRHDPETTVILRRDVVGPERAMEWCLRAFASLAHEAGGAGEGRGGATFAREFFEEGRGEVTAFLPVGAAAPGSARSVLPAADLAVVTVAGPYEDLDLAYGVLGEYVAERGIGAAGPIRERYLVGPDTCDDPAGYRTEVGWPILPATPGGS